MKKPKNQLCKRCREKPAALFIASLFYADKAVDEWPLCTSCAAQITVFLNNPQLYKKTKAA